MPPYAINFEAENAKKAAKIRALRLLLERCRTVLGNMALENKGANPLRRRWPFHHEPLRNDARGLLPVIDMALRPAEIPRLPQPQYQPSTEYNFCPMCTGWGDCAGCDGTGLDEGQIGTNKCEVCAGTGVCTECNGSGIDTDQPPEAE